ncbi:MAG: tetratricopeptide repeat protein [Nonlabens sp.]
MNFASRLFLAFCLFAFPAHLWSQEEGAQQEVNVDDLGNVTDAFKENFFNALAEKAKGNPDRAIRSLKLCLKSNPRSGAVHFELGKNYLKSSAFAKAESSIKTAIEIAGEREWLLDALYDAYRNQNKKDLALQTMVKLAGLNVNYEELLPLEYMNNGRYDEALTMLDRLDAQLGENNSRAKMRRQLLRMTGVAPPIIPQTSIADLEKQVAENPEDESAYVKLIFEYGKSGNQQKVLETARLLELNMPKSDKAQLALYRAYLEKNELEEGIQSVKRIFESAQFDTPTKVKVLNDYLSMSENNVELEQLLPTVIESFKNQVQDIDAYMALGDYLARKNQKSLALEFYEQGLELDSQDFELLKKAALLAIDNNDHARSLELTDAALEIFPAQALFYLLNGVALNHLERYDNAIDQLEEGLTYLLEEPVLERDIYSELATAYEKKGDVTTAGKMRSKVEALNKKLQ